jgi:hypothetical protein
MKQKTKPLKNPRNPGKSTRNKDYFVPTPAMQIYAVHRAKLGEKATNVEISKIISISESYISRWQKIPGFNEWLAEEIEYYSLPILKLLEGVAMRNLQDHKFWETMAKKYNFHETGDGAKNPDEMVNDGKFVFIKPRKVVVSDKE